MFEFSWFKLLKGMSCGAMAGVISGLTGIGSGTIIVPAMVYLLGLNQHKAHGTSLAVILPTALIGASIYMLHHKVILSLALIIGITGILSSYLGSRVASYTNEKLLRTYFGLFLMIIATILICEPKLLSGFQVHLALSEEWGILLGLIGGFFSGLLGIGGGVILMPGMIYLMSVEQHKAVATSLAAMIPVTLTATISHHRYGNVDWIKGIYIALGSLPCVWLGVKIALILSVEVIQTLLGLLLLFFSFHMIFIKR